MFFRVLALVICLVSSVSATGTAEWTQYEGNITFSIPAYELVEPIRIWYDKTLKKQRLDYYDGLDIQVLDGSESVPMSYSIGPQYNEMVCTKAPMSWLGSDFVEVLPDLSDFKNIGKETIADINSDQILCDTYLMVITNNGVVSNYIYYADASDGMPIKYQIAGYDIVFNSHFADYVIMYGKFSPVPIDPKVFEVNMNCTLPSENIDIVNFARSSAINDLGRMFHTHKAFKADDVSVFFKQYLTKMNISIKQDEFESRKFDFRANLVYVNAKNRQHKSYKLSVDRPFAHLSWKQIQRTLGLNGPTKHAARDNGTSDNNYHQTSKNVVNAASHFSWVEQGGVTEVRDQGICDSGYTFSAAGAMEGAYFMKYKTLNSFSTQFLVDCGYEDNNQGCNGGIPSQAYDTVIRYGGMTIDEYYPYIMANGVCEPPDLVTLLVSIAGYVNIKQGDETALLDAGVTHGPISVAIDVTQDLFFYSSGIFDDPTCKSAVDDLDHAVLMVGWGISDDGTSYWILKNSWGTLYGMEGYMYFKQGGNVCGIATTPTYAIAK